MPVPAFVTHPYAIGALVVVGGGVALYELVFKKKHKDDTAPTPPADASDAAAAQAAQAANGNVPTPAPTDDSTAIAATPSADGTPPPPDTSVQPMYAPPPAVVAVPPPPGGPPIVGPWGGRRGIHRPRPPAMRAPAPGMHPVVVAPAIVGGMPVPTGDIVTDVAHRLAWHGYRETDMPLYRRAQKLFGLHQDGWPGPAFMRALSAAARVKGVPMPHLRTYEFKNMGAAGWNGHNAPLLKDWKAR
jgi:hypothetical protein